MKRRVTNIQVLPADDNFILDGALARASKMAGKNRRAKAIFLAAILLGLFTASGCGKSKNNEAEASATATIECTYTPDVPEATPEVTPEPTAEPTAAVDPEAVENARIEEAAKAYYERLSANPGYPNDYATVLEFTKRFNGNFDSLQDLSGLDAETRQAVKLQYYNEMVDFMIDYINTMINNVSAEIFEGKKSESPNPETVLIYGASKEVSGLDTTKLVEDLGIEVRKSVSDWGTFKQNAINFQNLIATLYLESGDSYNGVEITAINSMNKRAETITRLEAMGFMAVIQMMSQVNGEKIETTISGSEKCYSTEDIIATLAGSLDCTVGSWALDATTELLLEMDVYQGTKQKALTYRP